MTEKELTKLTKGELEELCRTKGVELDKRLTKGKLIKEAKNLFSKLKTKKTTAAPAGRCFRVKPGNSTS